MFKVQRKTAKNIPAVGRNKDIFRAICLFYLKRDSMPRFRDGLHKRYEKYG